jgi:hypothetical protein
MTLDRDWTVSELRRIDDAPLHAIRSKNFNDVSEEMLISKNLQLLEVLQSLLQFHSQNKFSSTWACKRRKSELAFIYVSSSSVDATFSSSFLCEVEYSNTGRARRFLIQYLVPVGICSLNFLEPQTTDQTGGGLRKQWEKEKGVFGVTFGVPVPPGSGVAPVSTKGGLSRLVLFFIGGKWSIASPCL